MGHYIYIYIHISIVLPLLLFLLGPTSPSGLSAGRARPHGGGVHTFKTNREMNSKLVTKSIANAFLTPSSMGLLLRSTG